MHTYVAKSFAWQKVARPSKEASLDIHLRYHANAATVADPSAPGAKFDDVTIATHKYRLCNQDGIRGLPTNSWVPRAGKE